MGTLTLLVKDVKKLPTIPAVAVRILQEAKNEKSSPRRLADIVSSDPALAAKILKIANSSFYALPYKVDSLDTAVNIIGFEALKNVALTFLIIEKLKKNSDNEFDHEFFWKRSLTSAVCARMLAAKLNLRQDNIFITSLLMDIGVLVIYMMRPEDFTKIPHEKRFLNSAIVDIERHILGFDHQEVGKDLLESWGIPESVSVPVAYHHNPEECPAEYRNAVDLLVLSEMTSSVYHGERGFERAGRLKQNLKDRLNIDDKEALEFIDSVAKKTVEVLSFYEIDPGDMKAYSEILQEANEELSKMNTSYGQLVNELKLAKGEAEDLAVELWRTKEKMKDVAIRDYLTGLFNHRYFHDIMDKEIFRVERFNHILSVIIIDIDDFKEINDRYGHLTGDDVLRAFGMLMSLSVRNPDVATRYGGEEFAIILPETDTAGAISLAERIAQSVKDIDVKDEDDNPVRITVSSGVTTYDPSKGIKSKAEIIHAADMALYRSKVTGKDRLSVVSLY